MENFIFCAVFATFDIKLWSEVIQMKLIMFNPFSTNVPFMDKPDNWLLLAKCLKNHLWKSDILSKYAGHRPARSFQVKPSLGH